MHDLELIEGEGWILKGDKIPTHCDKCGEKLETPFFYFFYCKEFGIGFCARCEKTIKKRLCKSFEIEHEHFNIIEVK